MADDKRSRPAHEFFCLYVFLAKQRAPEEEIYVGIAESVAYVCPNQLPKLFVVEENPAGYVPFCNGIWQRLLFEIEFLIVGIEVVLAVTLFEVNMAIPTQEGEQPVEEII